MIIEPYTQSYGFERHIGQMTFDQGVEYVTAALQKEGFGVLTKIDVKETLKKKLDVEFRPYVILGACNPVLARQAIDVEPHVGLLLPCNVVVQEDPAGGILVSIADPRAMFTLVDNPLLTPIVEEAGRRIGRVAASLS